MIVAFTFSVIEAVFTKMNPDPPPGAEKGVSHTTFEQWYLNVLYTPISIIGYTNFFNGLALSPAVTVALYILCFPFNIWLLEIIMGYFLIWLYGTNVAWTYVGCDDALFHGNIRSSMYGKWCGLGAAAFLIYPVINDYALLYVI